MSSEKLDRLPPPAENPPNPPERQLAQVPDVRGKGEYPLIDNDPHIKRVFSYARPRDWAEAALFGSVPPVGIWAMEKLSPTAAPKSAFPPILRLNTAVGAAAGLLWVYAASNMRFYGAAENAREVEMDMREMVDKAKRGEPLYGTSSLTPYMQSVAHRNSRYTAFWVSVIPWPNFVNHPYHGVDTAKYYQRAEMELEQERSKKGGK